MAVISNKTGEIRMTFQVQPLPLALALALGITAAHAQSAPPEQKPILDVEGNVKEGKALAFDRKELEKLGVTTIRTTTPWHDGVQTFEGVPMVTLMKEVGAKGAKVQVMALNKYRTEIPMEDFARHQPILALKRDGKYMDVRDKGPLFIIYPFDSNPELKSEQYYSRSAWQVRSITVE